MCSCCSGSGNASIAATVGASLLTNIKTMNKMIAGLLLAGLMVPGVSHAQVTQTDLDSQLDALKAQLIALLMEQVKVLQAQLVALEDEQDETEVRVAQVEQKQVGPVGSEVEDVVPKPTVEVSWHLSETNLDGEVDDDTGRDFIILEVTGDWEQSKVKLTGPNGWKAIDGGVNEPRERDGKKGHFFDISSAPSGTYTWEVTAFNGGDYDRGEFRGNPAKTVETGSFTVE